VLDVLQHRHLEGAETPDSFDHFLSGSVKWRTDRHAYSRCLFHCRNTKPARQRIVDDTIGGRREEAAPFLLMHRKRVGPR
jgi:hypothetical protein